MAKVKGYNPPETEFAYDDATGDRHYFGEFLRMIFGEGSVDPADPETDIIGKTRRGERPTQQGEGTESQRFYREAFKNCTLLWNSLPEECPDPLPDPPPTSKKSVWDAKIEHGVPCSYYDLFMKCCIQWANWHAGAMPVGDCFPCISLCDCVDILIGYTTQQMTVNEEQSLEVIGAVEGCVYNWEITSGGGSLSAETGESVIYTAPESNENCEQNPTITLSVKGEICDTLDLAVNAWEETGGWENAAYASRSFCISSPAECGGTCAEQCGCFCYGYDIYNCDGSFSFDYEGLDPVYCGCTGICHPDDFCWTGKACEIDEAECPVLDWRPAGMTEGGCCPEILL